MKRVDIPLALSVVLALGVALPSGAGEQQARPRSSPAGAASQSSGRSQPAVRSNPAPAAASARVAVPRVSGGVTTGDRGAPVGVRATGTDSRMSPSMQAQARPGGSRQRPSTAPPTGSAYSRPRNGRYPTGQAVSRPPGHYPGYGPGYRPGYGHGYYPGYNHGYYPGYYYPYYWGAGWYYPWGLGAWGFAYGYGWPYWGWGGYYGTSYAYVYNDIGSLRIMVSPRDAHVYVDGYYVGVVDEFDGTFQRLELPEGPHRIEVRADGFATLTFDVRVIVNHTIKLRGVLQPLP